MDVEKCRTFVTAAESDTFTAAADKLYMTTANVTKHIASMERELGFLLFERQSHGVRLTEEGKRCLPYARQILQASRAMSAVGGRQRLKIGSIPSQQRIGLPEIIAAFQRAFPDILLEVEEHHGLRILENLLNDEYEIGFLGNLYSENEALEYIRILKEPLCAILPADHRFAGEKKISLLQLKDEEFVFLPPESGMYQICRDICRRCGFEPRIRMTVSREDTMLSYIENHIGISLCGRSYLTAGPIRNAAVVELEEAYYSGCVLARKKNRQHSENADAFWRFVKKKQQFRKCC
ncbi:MAG: LysR family transcriptional regulator [Enterocloster sp.]